MIKLAPEWARDYSEFWNAISSRNLWFIRLRYMAVIVLLGFLLLGEYLLQFEFTSTQVISILLIGSFIIIYNLIIHSTSRYVGNTPGKFNSLHLSLLQMALDLTALMFLVYFTGIIESPLYMLFIFHMIIGSMILPGYVIYFMAGLVTAVFGLLIFLQRIDLTTNYLIQGLYTNLPNHVVSYDILFVLIFGFIMFMSVYMTNKITKQLYQREHQLRNTLEALNEAEISKQKYIIGVVHEIKTPVSAVQSIIDVVLQKYLGPIDKQVEDRLKRAKLRNEEAVQMINDILRISKLKLLDIKSLEEINVVSFIQTMIENHAETARVKNIVMSFNDNRKVNKILKADHVLFELAISNLLNNSIKYTEPNGNIEIDLSEDGDHLIIEICDDGVGIPQGEREKIFDQFYRAGNIDKLKIEGSGMGLVLVKEIIVRHQGEIEVKSPSKLSKPGRPGSCFEIKIPYQPETEEKKDLLIDPNYL